MYEDQIFALLSHNGAGQSSAINMMCGIISKSKGTVSIYGFDIETEMNEIKKMIWISTSTQHSVSGVGWEKHFQILVRFKGSSQKETDEEFDFLTKDINLGSKRNVLFKDMSGGYKQKLCLGIALVGGSKVVFLDVLSIGMDVTAIREMWDMLKEYKGDRIIILTTYSMKEAEALSTTMGIMVDGQFKWFGSKQHTKNKFGTGCQV